MIFYSRHKKLKVALLMPTEKDEKNMFLCAFRSSGLIGTYETKDEKVIELLQAHSLFGKSQLGGFTAKVMDNGTKGNIVKGQQGYRESEAEANAEKEKIKLKADYKKFDALKDEILKVDKTYRKDASEKDIAKYEMLKEQLGL